MIKITREEYKKIKKDVQKLIKIEMIQMEMINDLLDERIKLKNRIRLIGEIIEKELPPNEFITKRLKKIIKGAIEND